LRPSPRVGSCNVTGGRTRDRGCGQERRPGDEREQKIREQVEGAKQQVGPRGQEAIDELAQQEIDRQNKAIERQAQQEIEKQNESIQEQTKQKDAQEDKPIQKQVKQEAAKKEKSSGQEDKEKFLESKASDPRLTGLCADLQKTKGVDKGTLPLVNNEGDAAVYTVTANTAPSSRASEDLVNTLRNDVIPKATKGEQMGADVGGTTASYIDRRARSRASCP
jgi:hypothetical protein